MNMGILTMGEVFFHRFVFSGVVSSDATLFCVLIYKENRR